MADTQAAINQLTVKALNEEIAGEALRSEARRLKFLRLADIQAAWRDVGYLDSLVQRYAFDPTWHASFSQEEINSAASGQLAIPPATSSRPFPRRERALAIANETIDAGAPTAVASEVAKRLREEGDAGSSLKDLTTAVGNIFARSDEWERVRPGEYRRVRRGAPSATPIDAEEGGLSIDA